MPMATALQAPNTLRDGLIMSPFDGIVQFYRLATRGSRPSEQHVGGLAAEVVPGLVEVEVAVPRLMPAFR